MVENIPTVGPTFPVIFYDGVTETNIGEIRIYPNLEYKPFQLMLSQRIGISPNQISIYLIDRRKSAVSPRVPITGKVNFAYICCQKECSFYVVLKRSRKSRTRRVLSGGGFEFGDFLPGNDQGFKERENVVLLRRNQEGTGGLGNYHLSSSSSLNLTGYGFNNNNINNNLNLDTGSSLSGSGYGLETVHGSRNLNNLVPVPVQDMRNLMMTKREKVYCEECVKESETGDTTLFHRCVNDLVITRYRTRLGPIGRPV